VVGRGPDQPELVRESQGRSRMVRGQRREPDRPLQPRLGPAAPLQKAQELADQEQAMVAGAGGQVGEGGLVGVEPGPGELRAREIPA
jgi:hypothetical protein